MSFFFFSSRRRYTSWPRDWSTDVCSSDLPLDSQPHGAAAGGNYSCLRRLSTPSDLSKTAQFLRGGSGWLLSGYYQGSSVHHPCGQFAPAVGANRSVPGSAGVRALDRSEERRVGKEWRGRRGGGTRGE